MFTKFLNRKRSVLKKKCTSTQDLLIIRENNNLGGRSVDFLFGLLELLDVETFISSC